MADFEWDPQKEYLNIKKHGVAFTTAMLIWDGPVFERVGRHRDYGEIRFQAFGVAEQYVLTVIFTWRGTVRRIISARRANFREKTLFETDVSNLRKAPRD